MASNLSVSTARALEREPAASDILACYIKELSSGRWSLAFRKYQVPPSRNGRVNREIRHEPFENLVFQELFRNPGAAGCVSMTGQNFHFV
jgi:hypothetical protein